MIDADAYTLSPELRRLVDNELDRDERLVWLAQPDPKAFTRGYWPIQLFGIPFTAFSVFWITMAASMGGGLFALFGLPFVLVGSGMLTAPYWGRRWARKSVYALTDGRAIVFKQEWNGMSIRSFRPEQLGSIERRQYADGAGDLIFAKEIASYGNRNHGPRINQIGFIGVANVKQVEDLLEKLADSE
ncbi:hypothetical protein [Botrimarina mediterranea]|uniref:DUF304 domain-containing protein n=1 Tax=Botrimarina mediterranea TaxID=2528022 RepID=A0A518K4E7_9BACT|nr:hypothetical protein [Botrimarina mediterranea]QDV72671.1 hypothetical protein Spa11_08520 [Botrimarina mediterranea]QDV77243.1 hypothetical protein K2D_08330 [Planctomycetes bacterium K2D]